MVYVENLVPYLNHEIANVEMEIKELKLPKGS